MTPSSIDFPSCSPLHESCAQLQGSRSSSKSGGTAAAWPGAPLRSSQGCAQGEKSDKGNCVMFVLMMYRGSTTADTTGLVCLMIALTVMS